MTSVAAGAATVAQNEGTMANIGTKIKEGANWLGHKISTGWKFTSEKLKVFFTKTLPNFLRTGNGVASVAGALGVALFIWSNSCKQENKSGRVVLGIMSIASLFFAGYMVGTKGPQNVF